MVKTTFRTHHYKWRGEVRRQTKGGAIGLRATGSLARNTMDTWIQEFRDLLESQGVEIILLEKYVDDVVIVCKNIGLGRRFSEGSLELSEEWKTEDKLNEVTESDNTMRYLREAAN